MHGGLLVFWRTLAAAVLQLVLLRELAVAVCFAAAQN